MFWFVSFLSLSQGPIEIADRYLAGSVLLGPPYCRSAKIRECKRKAGEWWIRVTRKLVSERWTKEGKMQALVGVTILLIGSAVFIRDYSRYRYAYFTGATVIVAGLARFVWEADREQETIGPAVFLLKMQELLKECSERIIEGFSPAQLEEFKYYESLRNGTPEQQAYLKKMMASW